MVASSVSTYLDVTKAASGADSPSQKHVEGGDAESMTQAAKVLAAIHAGAELVAQLTEKTGFDTTEVLAALSWLAKAGLVELEDQDGSLRARLTEPTRAALNSA